MRLPPVQGARELGTKKKVTGRDVGEVVNGLLPMLAAKSSPFIADRVDRMRKWSRAEIGVRGTIERSEVRERGELCVRMKRCNPSTIRMRYERDAAVLLNHEEGCRHAISEEYEVGSSVLLRRGLATATTLIEPRARCQIETGEAAAFKALYSRYTATTPTRSLCSSVATAFAIDWWCPQSDSLAALMLANAGRHSNLNGLFSVLECK